MLPDRDSRHVRAVLILGAAAIVFILWQPVIAALSAIPSQHTVTANEVANAWCSTDAWAKFGYPGIDKAGLPPCASEDAIDRLIVAHAANTYVEKINADRRQAGLTETTATLLPPLRYVVVVVAVMAVVLLLIPRRAHPGSQ